MKPIARRTLTALLLSVLTAGITVSPAYSAPQINTSTDAANSIPQANHTAPQAPHNTAPENERPSMQAGQRDKSAKTTWSISGGIANWDFMRSFRDYVGLEGETLSEGAGLLPVSKSLTWSVKDTFTFDSAHPSALKTIHFKGRAKYWKYNGLLDITLANPTLDLAGKRLLVDASTAGTMIEGSGPASVTQEALLQLNDLHVEMRDDYLLIFSLKPIVTDLSTTLFGFYAGEPGSPFVAVLPFDDAGEDSTAVQPELWNIFPDKYKKPGPNLDTANEPTKTVKIQNKELHNCILDELDLDADTPLTNRDLEKLTVLDCSWMRLDENKKIDSLAGLESAINLSRLVLPNQKISDLQPLHSLRKLVDLNVSHNELISLQGIENAQELVFLRADNNSLNDLLPLAALEKLQSVQVSHNKLGSLAGLPDEPDRLTTLDFSHNHVRDVQLLASIPVLRKINGSHNHISDVSPLAKLILVEEVNMSNNFITNPETLAPWATTQFLKELRLSRNKFTNWDSLDALGAKLVDRPAKGKEQDALNPAERPVMPVVPTATPEPSAKPVPNPAPSAAHTPNPAPSAAHTASPAPSRTPEQQPTPTPMSSAHTSNSASSRSPKAEQTTVSTQSTDTRQPAHNQPSQRNADAPNPPGSASDGHTLAAGQSLKSSPAPQATAHTDVNVQLANTGVAIFASIILGSIATLVGATVLLARRVRRHKI